MSWSELALSYPASLLDAVKARLLAGTSREIEAVTFERAGFDPDQVRGLLEQLSKDNTLEARSVPSCPDCGYPIEPTPRRPLLCPNCHHNFDEEGDAPVPVRRYFVVGQLSRDVSWVIALHGFNTRGDWQQEFSWRVANKLRYHAPVLMYRFPMSRYSVMLRWRHKQLARQIAKKLRIARDFAAANGILEPPDVVAHSFGTLLLATLLELDDCEDVKFGRVILAGSIVHPGYDFAQHIRAGRCEAVLNHCGSRDLTVGVSQYLIPTSGPAGTNGIQDKAGLNIRTFGYGHGTFFEEDAIANSLDPGGPWDLFLRVPLRYLDSISGVFSPLPWKPASKWMTGPTRAICTVVPLPLVIMCLHGITMDAIALLNSYRHRT